MITGLNHITLAVTDMDKSFAFYRDILGFKPLCKWAGSSYFLIGSVNPLWLCLDRCSQRQSTPCSTHYAFSVLPEDFQEMSERIIQSDTQILKENTSPGDICPFCPQ
jgi:catechol 2,3-dioxygenase-like lactoylglutathione lyase family enzyme